jgi:Domain of unknown function (DUF1816)
MHIQEIWLDALEFFGLAWWIEIVTERPNCTYYFGPFASEKEAKAHKSGYVEDLESEASEGIRVQIERCKPSQITIDRESSQSSDYYLPQSIENPLHGQFG